MAAMFLMVAAGIILLSASALGSKTFEPVYKPALQVAKSISQIKVDGKLDEPAWKSAGKASNFVERYPGDMTQPEVETEAYITYDNENLYVAFVCHDDPNAIRATMCQRDQFGGDDAVALLLDTFGDATRAYEFFVNPYGIQKDRLWSSVAGEDPGFDLIWHSAAEITPTGYQVEMAIPFSSLRFPNKEVQSWKMDFWRNRPRDSFKQYSWAAYDRNEQCWVCQWGTVDGIANVRPGKGIELLPTLVANQSGSLNDRRDPDSDIDNGDILGEPSLGLKYSFTSDIVLDAALNPDFSQIEADAAQIDVNSPIALFYSERRPYFQEGSDIFRTLFNSFYTRTVNDPSYTTKLTARMERTTIGFLSAYDETSPYVIPLEEGTVTINGGKSTVNVLRGLQTIGDDTRMGFILSDRRFRNNGSGTVFALDGDIRLTRNYSIDGQVVYTHTQEPDDDAYMSFFEDTYAPRGWEDSVNTILPMYDITTFDQGKHTFAFDGESYSGIAFISRLRRNSRHLNFTIDYNQVPSSYRTEVGFDPYMNYRNFSISSFYSIYPKSNLFERITPQIYTLNRWNFEGVRKLRLVNLGIDGQLKYAQTDVHLSYSNKEEMYGGVGIDNLWNLGLNFGSTFSNKLGYSIGTDYGRDIAYAQSGAIKGEQTSLFAYLYFKPVDQFIIEPRVSYVRNLDNDSGDKLFRQFIARSRFSLQVNRELSVRLVVQYNDYSNIFGSERQTWEVDPLLTYRLGSFSVFYLGSTTDSRYITRPDSSGRWALTDRQFFMKIQYLFQV